MYCTVRVACCSSQSAAVDYSDLCGAADLSTVDDDQQSTAIRCGLLIVSTDRGDTFLSCAVTRVASGPTTELTFCIRLDAFHAKPTVYWSRH